MTDIRLPAVFAIFTEREVLLVTVSKKAFGPSRLSMAKALRSTVCAMLT